MSPPVPDELSLKTVAAITPSPVGASKCTPEIGITVPEDSPLQVESGTYAEHGPTELQRFQDTIAQMLQKINELKEDLKAKSLELKASCQRIQRLEAERDTLQKKCDTASRRADALQRDNTDLLNSVLRSDNQIKSLAREKHQAIAGHLHAQSLNIEKDKDIQNLNRELNAIATAYQALTRRHNPESSSRKQSTGAMQGNNFRFKSGQAEKRRVVQCRQCYTKRWVCDAGHPCKACIVRSIPDQCARLKCQFWERGTCKKPQCGLAHEEDGFPVLEEFRRLKQKAPPKLPNPLQTTPGSDTSALTSKEGAPQANSQQTNVDPASNNPKRPRDVESGSSNSSTDRKRLKLLQTPVQDQAEFPLEMDTELDATDAPGRTMFFNSFTVLSDYAHTSIEEARVGDYRIGNIYAEHYPKEPLASEVDYAASFVGGRMPDAATQCKLDIIKLFGLSDEQAKPEAIQEARRED